MKAYDKLKILEETTWEDYPIASIILWTREMMKEYEQEVLNHETTKNMLEYAHNTSEVYYNHRKVSEYLESLNG